MVDIINESNNYRLNCWDCFQPKDFCYCDSVKKISLPFDVTVLQHPIEARKRMATGRMVYRLLKNSYLFRGHDYSDCQPLNQLLNDASLFSLLVYPTERSYDFDKREQRLELQSLRRGRRLNLIFVDGTWATAKKTMRLSHNLHKLPAIRFNPKEPSQFKVRKQPQKFCLSTIEAVHYVANQLLDSWFVDQNVNGTETLMRSFARLVDGHIQRNDLLMTAKRSLIKHG